MLGQSNAGIRRVAATPPTTAPSGKPQNISDTRVERNRVGAYSEVIEIRIGKAPPRPRPVTSLTAISGPTAVVSGVARVTSAKSSIATIRAGFRPTRSAPSPNRKAPIRLPNSPAPNTIPNAEAFAPQAVTITGATSAIDWVSKPSTIATRAQSPKITICRLFSGLVSTMVSRSSFPVFIRPRQGVAGDVAERTVGVTTPVFEVVPLQLRLPRIAAVGQVPHPDEVEQVAGRRVGAAVRIDLEPALRVAGIHRVRHRLRAGDQD